MSSHGIMLDEWAAAKDKSVMTVATELLAV